MKKTAIILVMAIMPLAMAAQQDVPERIFQKYSGIPGITSVQISPGMFNLIAGMDPDDHDLKSLASAVSSVLILHAPEALVKSHSFNLYNEVLKDLTVEQYDELMRVSSAEQQVLMLASEEGGLVKELILLVGGDGDNVLICIKGSIDMNKIASLSGINAPGMQHFMNLND